MGLVRNFASDVRVAVRSLRRSGLFAVLAMITLAVGLGANIAAFSAFDAVFAPDLPVRNPQELVAFHWLRTNDSMVAGYSGYGRPGPNGTSLRTSFSPITFERFRASSQTLAEVFAFRERLNLTVNVDGDANTASGQIVSGNYYTALGVPAFRGRVLADTDDAPGAPAVAVITYRYWKRRFAADPAAIGRSVLINGQPAVIVGVTPEGFDGTLATETSDVTLPLAQAGLTESNGRPRPRSTWSLRIMGRLKPGATIEQVEPELVGAFNTTVREAWEARPASTPNPGRSGMPVFQVVSGRQGPDGPRRDAMGDLAVMVAVSGAILVIGCANLASLVLIRGLKRRREIALRLALGASRGRIVRLLLAENLVLSVAGGSIGVLLAFWGKNFLSWFPGTSAPLVSPSIDARTLAFALGLSTITSILFGLVPSLKATRQQLGTVLKRSGWRRLAGRTMVIVQVAGCVVFLATVGLAVRSMQNLGSTDLGFDAENMVVFRVALSGDAAKRIPSPLDAFTEAVQTIPGVTAATYSAVPLVARSEWSETLEVDGDATPREVHFQVVGPEFVKTVGMRVMSGRDFSAADRSGSAYVALVNERMAHEVFNNTPAVGRYFQLKSGSPRDVPIQVVGIVNDAKYASVEDDAPATMYLAAAQTPQTAVTYELRTAADPAGLLPALRDAAKRLLPNVALANVTTQREQIDGTTEQTRTLAWTAGVFSVVAVLLACLGLYSVVSFDINQRRRELSVRVALGATPRQLLHFLCRDVVSLVAIGSLIGIAIAIGASSAASSLFFGVTSSDPVVLGLAVAVFTLAALTAAAPSAWRASKISPAVGLKQD